jgi:hypothetical protein
MKRHDYTLPLIKTSGFRTALFLMATGVFLYLRTCVLPGIPMAAQNDAVFFFEHAKRILIGQVPFRDFFVFVMPGTDLLYAGLFRLFGIHAWLVSAIVILLGLSLTAVLLQISKRLLSGNLVFLPATLFLVFDFDNARDATHHWYSTLLVMLAVLTLLRGRTYNRILVAGALCGVATVFTQTQGFLGFVAVAIFIIWMLRAERKSNSLLIRTLATLIFPFILIVGGTLGYYAHLAGIRTLVYALWEYPHLFTAAQYSYPLLGLGSQHRFIDFFHKVSFSCLYLFGPLAYIFCFQRLFRQKHHMNPHHWEAVLLISMVGSALLVTVALGPSSHRLYTVAPPITVAFVWCFSGIGAIERKIQRTLWWLSIALFLYLPIRLQLLPRNYLDLPTGRTAFLSPEQYSVDRWLAEHTHANDYLFGLTPASFAVALRNPTPVDLILPSKMTTPAQEEAVIRSLQQYPATLVFLRHEEAFDDNARLQEFNAFIHNHYHLAKAFPSGEFWQVNQ